MLEGEEMSKREILNEAKRDLRAAQRERDFSAPALICAFFAAEVFAPTLRPDYSDLFMAVVVVYCLLSIRTAIHATALRKLIAIVGDES